LILAIMLFLRILSVCYASYLPAVLAQSTFTNPLIYSDFPDNDVPKGPDGAYYFSASSFQFSPGAPILKSLDLVNWELIGHSVPSVAAFGSTFEMQGTPAYVLGVWASLGFYHAVSREQGQVVLVRLRRLFQNLRLYGRLSYRPLGTGRNN
jgi:hypothetical protein